MKKYGLALLIVLFGLNSQAQTTAEINSQVDLDSLVKMVRELSGEDSTFVSGQKSIIKHRVSKRNNDLAAQYITEKLRSFGVHTFEHNYRTGGKNILGEIKGKTNPDSIYIICAHYDAVTDYCADDNASGTAAILEAARILSNYCLTNTVIFAFWDEEELGLVGSKNYGGMASARGDRIKGVFNMDMLGYDSDSNHVFDIHTNNVPHNLALKDSLLYLVDTLNLVLVPQVINPGTNRSDHAAFWNAGYPAVFFGESFLGGDPTPAYHTKNDRINLFNMPYYHNLSKLATAVITEFAGIVQPDRTFDTIQACEQYTIWGRTLSESGMYSDTSSNTLGCDSIHSIQLKLIHINDSVARNDRVLTAIDSTASYQWFACNDPQLVLFADTNRSFTVQSDGSYAVQLSKEGCLDSSDCFELNVSSVNQHPENQFVLFPNPSNGFIQLEYEPNRYQELYVFSTKGAEMAKFRLSSVGHDKIMLDLPSGMYMIKLLGKEHSSTKRLVLLPEH